MTGVVALGTLAIAGGGAGNGNEEDMPLSMKGYVSKHGFLTFFRDLKSLAAGSAMWLEMHPFWMRPCVLSISGYCMSIIPILSCFYGTYIEYAWANPGLLQ